MLRLRVFEVILIFICRNKMSGGNKYFFRPRKGENYSQGFNGLKTLVVGAYHFCWEAHAGSYGCTYYDRCVREGRSREFDDLCPIYKSRMDLYDGYYRISNSNIIEIDSYTEGERCPSYGEFTHFMTGIRGRIITQNERLDFWNSVAFYNYIQHFLPEAEDFSYQERKSVLDADFPAFMQVLEELEPDVIYIWTDAVKDAVFSNAHRLGGTRLKLMGNHSVGSMSVWEVAVSYDGRLTANDITRLVEKAMSWSEKSGTDGTGPESPAIENMENKCPDKRQVVRNLLSSVLSFRKHEYDVSRFFPGADADEVKTVLQPYAYDDAAVTGMTDIYLSVSGLGKILALQQDNIRKLTADSGVLYSTFLYPEAVPVNGVVPDWLTLWKPGQGVELKMLGRTMTDKDVLLAWIDDMEPWPLVFCREMLTCILDSGGRMLLLMKPSQDSQYFMTFKDSGMVNAIYEAEDSLLLEFTPESHDRVAMYPDDIVKRYARFTMLTPSRYRKNQTQSRLYESFLRNDMKISETDLIEHIAGLLHNAPDIVHIVKNGQVLRIVCIDKDSDRTVRLIYEIRQAVRLYAFNKNRFTYKDIQDMLHTDIPNIEKRISDLNLKHRRRRGISGRR